ncbi:MAG: hypothetical protein J1E02_05810 [Coprobacter sp.]|nr:hypothetical protein [Coprobacter sp.]
MRSKLVYIVDPYCIWCYGNEQVITHVYETYHRRLDFKVLAVGLWTGDKRKPATAELARMFRYQTRKVSDITDVPFGNAFYRLIDDPTRIFDSELPSMAMTAVDKYWHQLSIPFCNLLLRTLYYEGKDLSELTVYEQLARRLELSPEEFLRYLCSDEVKRLTQERYAESRSLAYEYPGLLYVDFIGGVYPISNGYARYSDVQRRINCFL